MASFLQPPLDHVGMRRFAKCQLERPREMRRASPRNRAQIPGMNRAVQVLVDKGPHPRDLAVHQPTRSGALRARVTLDLVLQDGRSSSERCLRRLAIMLQLMPRHFKELCQAACQVAEGQ